MVNFDFVNSWKVRVIQAFRNEISGRLKIAVTIQYNYRPHKQLYVTDSQIKKINFIDFHRKTSFACFKICELSEAISRK